MRWTQGDDVQKLPRSLKYQELSCSRMSRSLVEESRPSMEIKQVHHENLCRGRANESYDLGAGVGEIVLAMVPSDEGKGLRSYLH